MSTPMILAIVLIVLLIGVFLISKYFHYNAISNSFAQGGGDLKSTLEHLNKISSSHNWMFYTIAILIAVIIIYGFSTNITFNYLSDYRECQTRVSAIEESLSVKYEETIERLEEEHKERKDKLWTCKTALNNCLGE